MLHLKLKIILYSILIVRVLDICVKIKSCFQFLDDWNSSMIIFGSGATVPILGKCIVNISGLLATPNVLYVNSLKSNLFRH